jgi:hypothetical protein
MAAVLLTGSAGAEMITTLDGIGGDMTLRRGNPSDNGALLLIKNQGGNAENNNNDRLGMLKFDLSVLSDPITASIVRLEMPRGAATAQPNNTFDAGETVYLYGIPDGATGEDFNEGTLLFANSPYLTGTGTVTNPRPVTDMTGNSVNDSLATLLDTHTFAAVTNAGEIVDFRSPLLRAFLQADTNNIASFILTVGQSNATKTPVFNSDTRTGTGLRPTLLTNVDVPEPVSITMTALAGACLCMLRRRETQPHREQTNNDRKVNV